ncbi:MAG: hypothetical protein IKL76_01935 [Clostridia bacterium]|nr:hypothetical protein [Clostridia bacterium]
MEKFAIGLLLGGVGGALLVANNYKMRTLVKKGQEEVQNKLNTMMDEKILAMEEKQAQEEKDEDSVSDKKSKKSAK